LFVGWFAFSSLVCGGEGDGGGASPGEKGAGGVRNIAQYFTIKKKCARRWEPTKLRQELGL